MNTRLRLFLAMAILGIAATGSAVSAVPKDSMAPATKTLSPAPAPAQHIRKGAVARRQVVALGRNVVIDGDALEDVAAINGSVEVSGSVRGDLIVLGGNARLLQSAVVEGDVFVVGGSLDAEPGADLGGRSVVYPSMSAAWLTLVEAPALGLGATSPVVLIAKLALLTAWLALLLLLFAIAGRQILKTADGVSQEPFRNFWVGLTGILSLVLTALLLGAFAGPVLGFPFVILVGLALLMAKLWGMVAVFYALGRWLYGRFGKRGTVLSVATLGLFTLGVLKLVPVVGLWTWTVATVIGVGAAFTTKFGRKEPWFELSLMDVLSK